MTVNQKVNILLILLLIVVASFMYWLLSNPVADDYNFSAYENLKNKAGFSQKNIMLKISKLFR